MDQRFFKKQTDRLLLHTGKTMKPDQFRQLYDQLREIGDAAYQGIIEGFIRELPMMPSRFPTVQAILAKWYAYKRAHQAGFYEERQECKTCRSQGLGYERIVDDNRINARRLVLCGDCENWRKYFGEDGIRSVSVDGVLIDTTTHDAPGGRAFIPFRRRDDLDGTDRLNLGGNKNPEGFQGPRKVYVGGPADRWDKVPVDERVQEKAGGIGSRPWWE